MRQGLCGLAQPELKQALYTPGFHFSEASVLLVTSGRMDLDDGANQVSVGGDAPLLLVDAGRHADLLKTPARDSKRFRSLFLTLSTTLLRSFQSQNSSLPASRAAHMGYQQLVLDTDLETALLRVFDGVDIQRVSDARLQCRLMEVLWSLAERGYVFKERKKDGTAERLRALISDDPGQQWTANEAGRRLAMSEATLRRRLVGESVRFEDILIDVRMHHAMMLLQTTSWSIPRIALVCGYQSRSRFAERFRTRFGYLPSAVR